jgi:hypothetical protein
MFSNTKSIVGNNTAQLLCSADGWTLEFPMRKENEKEANEALSLLFHRYGVTNVMVMDGAKAQGQGSRPRRSQAEVAQRWMPYQTDRVL